MAQLPIKQAVPRFQENEDRVNIFVNAPTGEDYYTTSEGENVKTLPKLVIDAEQAIQDVIDSGIGTGVIHHQMITTDGVSSTYPLTFDPIHSGNIIVNDNGIVQKQDSYSVVGTDLVFNYVPSAGVDRIEVLVFDTVPLGETDASQVSFTRGNGTETTVQTAVTEAIDKLTFYASDRPAAEILAAELGDGATVWIDRDETMGGVRVRWSVVDGALTGGVADEAGQIQYTPDVTAAVPTSVERKLKERKSFFDFLTDPTRAAAYYLRLGTLDYTAEIQAASDYSAGDGPAIEFPEGLAPHTGFTVGSGTFFVGAGVGKSELLNTHVTNDSVTVPYFNDGNFYRDWGIVGFTISAQNVRSPSQAGIRLNVTNHGYLSRIFIKEHYYGVREKACWSSYFEFVDADLNEYGWFVEDGGATAGVPNTRNCIGLNRNTYGLDIQQRGLNAAKWTGGHIERTTNWAIRILGSVNRTIAFDGLNIEGNNNASNGFDVIIGEDADANSAPANVRFSNCQFTDADGSPLKTAFDLNRGSYILLDNCHFINYLKIADISGNFGTFLLSGNIGPIFASTTEANTNIPSNGIVTGTRSAFTQIANGAITAFQSADTQLLLASRRYSETINRFDISPDGTMRWRPFNNATPNLTIKRHVSTAGVNVGGVEATDCWRTGLNTTANRPNAASVGAGSQFYDTTLSKPIWSDGTVWRDAAGTAV